GQGEEQPQEDEPLVPGFGRGRGQQRQQDNQRGGQRLKEVDLAARATVFGADMQPGRHQNSQRKHNGQRRQGWAISGVATNAWYNTSAGCSACRPVPKRIWWRQLAP